MTALIAGPVPDERPGPRSRTGVTIVAAVVAAVVLVAAAGWLLWPTPPGPAVLHAGTPRHLATVVVESPRVGTSAVDVDLTDRSGADVPAAAVEIVAVMPLMGHANPAVPAVLVPGTSGHRADGIDLMMTGPWELRVLVATPGTAAEVITLPVDVSG